MKYTSMARKFIFLAQDEAAGFQLGSSRGLVVLCFVAVSLSIISMVKFACADCVDQRPHRKGGGGHGGNVGGGCGGGSGGCGGGGGGWGIYDAITLYILLLLWGESSPCTK